MPRNGSGTMSVLNTHSSGDTISSAEENANNQDFASEITGSLPRDGQAGMTGQLKAASGTTAAPGMSFGSDTDTGLYRKSGNTMGMVAGGEEVATATTTGIDIPSGKTLSLNGQAMVVVPTGTMWPYLATTAPTSWVTASGKTIGNASSGATERANADTENLFEFLWNNFTDSICSVSSGRGISAQADYDANKTITLPDYRGRGFFGLDNIGGIAAGRLGNVITNETVNGTVGGAETVTLSVAELPAHSHTGNTDTDGVHSHSIDFDRDPYRNDLSQANAVNNIGSGASDQQTDIDGAHSHAFTTDNTGSGSAHANMPPIGLGTWIIKL